LRHAAASLGMDLSGLEKSGLLKIVEDPEVKSSARLAEFIQKYVDEVGAKRVVLDSLSIYRDIQGTDEKSTRGEILRLVNKMRALNIVLLVTAERGFSTIDDIYYLADDHLFQGVIMLMKLRSRATFERCICIVKVRGIDHSLRVHPLKISRGGITIYPDSTPFSLKAGGMDEQGNLG
jgi:circadian clock protein KaiC